MTIRKIKWISDLDIENLLAWLTDMSSHGYHFKKYNRRYTTFEKGKPKVVNYISAHINRHDEAAVKNHKVKLGTYGIIKGASTYILGIMKKLSLLLKKYQDFSLKMIRENHGMNYSLMVNLVSLFA